MVIPRPNLSASLSTEAQRILERGEAGQEWPPPIHDLTSNDLHQIGDLAQLGLGVGHWPSDFLIRLLEFCHVSTQFPWWGSIILVTVIVRITLFPLLLVVQRNTALVPYIAERQMKVLEEAKKAKEENDTRAIAEATERMWALYREQGYNPMLNIAGLLQVPVFFGMFRMSVRCSKFPVPGWDEGGALWFKDLSAIDPYFILPIFSGFTSVATIWVSSYSIYNAHV